MSISIIIMAVSLCYSYCDYIAFPYKIYRNSTDARCYKTLQKMPFKLQKSLSDNKLYLRANTTNYTKSFLKK